MLFRLDPQLIREGAAPYLVHIVLSGHDAVLVRSTGRLDWMGDWIGDRMLEMLEIGCWTSGSVDGSYDDLVGAVLADVVRVGN